MFGSAAIENPSFEEFEKNTRGGEGFPKREGLLYDTPVCTPINKKQFGTSPAQRILRSAGRGTVKKGYWSSFAGRSAGRSPKTYRPGKASLRMSRSLDNVLRLNSFRLRRTARWQRGCGSFKRLVLYPSRKTSLGRCRSWPVAQSVF